MGQDNSSSTASSGSGVGKTVMPTASSSPAFTGFGGTNGQSMANQSFTNPWSPPQQPFQPQMGSPVDVHAVMPATSANSVNANLSVNPNVYATRYNPINPATPAPAAAPAQAQAPSAQYYMDQFSSYFRPGNNNAGMQQWAPSPYRQMGNSPFNPAAIAQMPGNPGTNPILQQRDQMRRENLQSIRDQQAAAAARQQAQQAQYDQTIQQAQAQYDSGEYHVRRPWETDDTNSVN